MNITDEQKQEILADKEFMRQIISTYLCLPKEARTAYLRCAVTEAEAAQVQAEAEKLHMNVSEFMRLRVLAEINDTATKPA